MELTIGDRVYIRPKEYDIGRADETGTVVATVPGTGMFGVAVRRDSDGDVSVHFVIDGVEPDLVKEGE